MRVNLFLRAVYAAVAIASAAGTMWGQTFQGSVRGLVQDPGGAVIAGAKVDLVDQATNLARSTLSNAAGEYSFAAVDPATYTVRASAPGFKTLERKDVIVGTAETQTLDVKLEVGGVNESITVTEEVPLMETSNASNGEVINQEKLEDIPILGRNAFLMAKLANTVVQSGDPRFNRLEDQSGSSQITIGGGPIRGNNYTLDGIPITASSNVAIVIPIQEAVQEMKMQTGTYDATMGRTGGGVFNTVLKSGTNDIHLDALGYMRQAVLDGNQFFNNASGQPRPSQSTYTWAGSIGGPVFIPKIYNGKNKTFFYIATESYRDHQPVAGTSNSMPTAAEEHGDFSSAIQANGQPWLIYDPNTGQSCTAAGVTCPKNDLVVRQPFPGNIIPASRINPIGQNLMSYVPVAQTSSQVLGAANFNLTDNPLDRAGELALKGEHELTNWFRVTASFLYFKMREAGGNTIGTLPGNSYLLYRHVDATAVNAIMTPNPTTVITLRYGFNRYPNVTTDITFGSFQESSLGFSPAFLNQLQANYFPVVSINPGLGSTGSVGLSTGLSYSNYYSKNILGSVSKFIGRHNLTMGMDYRQINTGYNISPSAGNFNFTESATAGWTGQYVGTQGNSGSGFADALLGLITPASGSTGTVTTAIPLNNYVRYYSGYFQDDIRVSSKLTLNVGLRYEYETGEYEENNNLVTGFDVHALNPITGLSGVQAFGVPLFAGVDGNKTSTGSPSKTHLGPRFGTAYQLNGKTTLRAGFGVFYAPTIFSTSDGNLGFTQANTPIPSNDNYITPYATLSNPFPNGLIQPTGSSLGGLTGIGSTVSFVDPNRASGGTVYQFSADVQRELGYGLALEVGYIGSRSNGLGCGSLSASTSCVNLDQLPLSDNALGSALGATVANPFYGHGGQNTFSNATINQYYLLSPYPQYTGISESGNFIVAKYDSLAAKVTKRLAHGLTVLSTFTWAKNQDDNYGGGGGNSLLTFVGGSGGIQNSYSNIKQTEWGESPSDTPLRWTLSFTYMLPFGKGQRFLQNNSVLNYIVGGWQINDSTIYAEGFPTFIQQSNSNTFLLTANQRPNATGINPQTSGSLEQRLNDYYNPAAFSLAPAYTFGNVGRNISMRGPGMANWDISLFKGFRIKERFNGQFRAEALNAMNTPYFASPHTSYSPTSSSFGTITYQANLPRNLQLGIRMIF